MSPLAQALLAELTDEDLRVLAERLRPLLDREDDELLTPAVARPGVSGAASATISRANAAALVLSDRGA